MSRLHIDLYGESVPRSSLSDSQILHGNPLPDIEDRVSMDGRINIVASFPGSFIENLRESGDEGTISPK